MDYDIDYLQGRILLTEPLLDRRRATTCSCATAGSPATRRTWSCATSTRRASRSSTRCRPAAQGHYWFGDRVKLGADGEHERRGRRRQQPRGGGHDGAASAPIRGSSCRRGRATGMVLERRCAPTTAASASRLRRHVASPTPTPTAYRADVQRRAAATSSTAAEGRRHPVHAEPGRRLLGAGPARR